MLQRLHTFIRDIARKERSGFVRAETITEAINAASFDLWRSKVSKLSNANGEDWLLQPFRGSQTLTSAGDYTLAGGANYKILSVDPVDQEDIEITLADNDQEFTLIKSASEFKHLLTSDFPITINAASNGLADLPDDLFRVGQVFYHNYSGNIYEGQILEDREFIDRKNSVIIPATVTNPIARIHDNQIQFYPVPTGPNTYSFTLPYIKFNPVARYSVDGNDLTFEFKPTSYDLDINVYFLRPPLLATATYGTPVRGIQPLTVTQDLEWNSGAFAEIANRALTYIGISVNNQGAVQLESIVSQNNQQDANN